MVGGERFAYVSRNNLIFRPVFPLADRGWFLEAEE